MWENFEPQYNKNNNIEHNNSNFFVNKENEELSPEELHYYEEVCLKLINNNDISLSNSDFKTAFEKEMLKWVKWLPEKISSKLWVNGIDEINNYANNIKDKIQLETNKEKVADLQIQLIFQYIALTSRIQNWWMHWVLPSISQEINWLDCSISTWCLKQKLEQDMVWDISFSFGYPSWHAVWVIELADGRLIYADAQNWLISEIEIKQVYDEKNRETCYPIYEILKHNTLSWDIPTLWKTSLIREWWNDYIPKYLWITQNWIYWTLWNFHMMALKDNKDKKTYSTNTANQFRNFLNNDPDNWKKFEDFVSVEIWWKVIQETIFEELSYKHYASYKTDQLFKNRDEIEKQEKKHATLEKECIEMSKQGLIKAPIENISNMIHFTFKDFEQKFWNNVNEIESNREYENIIKKWVRLWHNEQRKYNWVEYWRHNGEDYMVEAWTSINSILDWKIVEVVVSSENQPNPGYWNTMVIEYTLPSWKMIYARYAHLSKIDWFWEGDIVKKWDTIWFVGKNWVENWGRPTHLHFQIMTKHWYDSYSNQKDNEYAWENIDPWKLF